MHMSLVLYTRPDPDQTCIMPTCSHGAKTTNQCPRKRHDIEWHRTDRKPSVWTVQFTHEAELVPASMHTSPSPPLGGRQGQADGRSCVVSPCIARRGRDPACPGPARHLLLPAAPHHLPLPLPASQSAAAAAGLLPLQATVSGSCPSPTCKLKQGKPK